MAYQTNSVRGGFTLIELIIVSMLIIFLAVAAISGMIESQRTFTFNTADQRVGSLVREARSLAVTGKSVIDYTDYDNDDCRDIANHGGSCATPADDDRVTPSHYGIYFSGNTMTLFADIRQANGSLHVEGAYDAPPPTTELGKYVLNKDIKLAEYEVTSSLNLLFEGSTGTAANTVMYSPIFADTAFAQDAVVVDLLTAAEFFVFGIQEKAPFDRANCLPFIQ